MSRVEIIDGNEKKKKKKKRLVQNCFYHVCVDNLSETNRKREVCFSKARIHG